MEEKIKLEFSKDEYAYLVGFLNASFNQIKKAPKKFRTEKFTIIENLVNNQFSISGSGLKSSEN